MSSHLYSDAPSTGSHFAEMEAVPCSMVTSGAGRTVVEGLLSSWSEGVSLSQAANARMPAAHSNILRIFIVLF